MAVVLVVDDGAANRELIQAYLSGIDCEVRFAVDGLSALAAIEADAPDLILLDVQMPGVDGYEVCRRIKAMPRGRLLPVVMITAPSRSSFRSRQPWRRKIPSPKSTLRGWPRRPATWVAGLDSLSSRWTLCTGAESSTTSAR
jgi:CheY-like chemotaxis protein